MRKKRRTAKQIAATRKMIRANRKAKRSSKKRRNPIAGAAEARKGRKKSKRKAARKPGRHKSRTRSGAAKKAARTRARNKAKRSLAAKKAARTRKRGGRRSSGRTRSGSFRRSPTKRQLSARKAVATRRRNKGVYGPYAPDASERKPKRRKAKRKNPIVSAAAETPRRKRRKAKRGGHKRNSYRRRGTKKRTYHHVKSSSYKRGGKTVRRRAHMRNPLIEAGAIQNPITGPMEFLGSVLGVGFGFSLASLGDRLVTTHALNAAGQDAPAAGQIYNSEALATPLWANFGTVGYKRMLAAAVAVIVPLGAAAAVTKHTGLKSFFQLMAFGALGRTAGKVVDDGVAHFMTTSPTAQRLYGGEIAATSKLTAATTTALPAAAPATFAGLPSGRPMVTRELPRHFSPLPPPPPPVAVRPIAGSQPQVQQAQRPVESAPFPALKQSFNPLLLNPDGQ